MDGYNGISGISSPQRGDAVPLVRQANNVSPKESHSVPPAERGCGLSTKSYSKIVGGSAAEKNEWPWMAAILRHGYHRAFCGGVLITNLHILTGIRLFSKKLLYAINYY